MLAIAVVLLSLRQPHLNGPFTRQICADVRSILKLKAATRGRCAAVSVPAFPLTRDVFSVVAGFSLTLTPVLLQRQWKNFGTLISYMLDRGSLVLDQTDSQMKLEAEVAKANRDFVRIGRAAPLTMLIMTVSMYLIMQQQARDGIFTILRPRGASASLWSHQAFNSWWANPQVSDIGATVYLVCGATGLYLITQQNMAGLRIILAFVRLRRHVTFGADPIDVDGYFGWLKVRSALVAVYLEISMHGAGLASFRTITRSGVLVGPLAVASWQWLATLPLFISFPFIFVRPKIKKYKQVEIARLDAEAHSIDPSLSLPERIAREDAISARIASVREMPSLPFNRLRDISIFILSVVANVFAVTPVLLSLALGH